jgi:hypothetical protein
MALLDPHAMDTEHEVVRPDQGADGEREARGDHQDPA